MKGGIFIAREKEVSSNVMTQAQVERAMNLLYQLYADQVYEETGKKIEVSVSISKKEG